jgi:hypothetical protein
MVDAVGAVTTIKRSRSETAVKFIAVSRFGPV